MAATFNAFFKITGVLNGLRESLGELNTPSTITTSLDELAKHTTTVGTGATTVILDIGAGVGYDISSPTVAIIVIPTVNGVLSFYGTGAADNSSIGCRANVPVILPMGTTTEYDANGLTRASTASQAIKSVFFYQNTGAAGKVHIFAIA